MYEGDIPEKNEKNDKAQLTTNYPTVNYTISIGGQVRYAQLMQGLTSIHGVYGARLVLAFKNPTTGELFTPTAFSRHPIQGYLETFKADVSGNFFIYSTFSAKDLYGLG